MVSIRQIWRAAAVAGAALLTVSPVAMQAQGERNQTMVRLEPARPAKARNVIFFVGDGMGVSTVTATRVYSVGVGGQLVVDQFPHTALSRTYSSDSITPDSAPTMTAMMTGVNTNQGVIGLDETTEPRDFNGDGDGYAPMTLLEEAKGAGMKVGVVSTARITHATPAATYAHINNRDNENAIALQALPGDATYNKRLKNGVDILMGGGRRFFVPSGAKDEEGENGSRGDLRDLRQEFKKAGYSYVWNRSGFSNLAPRHLPVLGLFERDHMEFEYDRRNDLGGEPSLEEMTVKSIDLLQRATRRGPGYFLMVESGRIDHAHHAGNAYRALTDTDELDRAIGAAARMVDLKDTLIIVSADHSHVFTIAGYPMRPEWELPYAVKGKLDGYGPLAGNGILDIVYDLDPTNGTVLASTDRNGKPYTVLSYANGPGHRGSTTRTDPRSDGFPGLNGKTPAGTEDPEYLQEATVPLGSETHAGEEVAIYAIGPGAELVRGTVKNTHIYRVMKRALGL